MHFQSKPLLISFLCGFFIFLASCTTTIEKPKFRDISFKHLPPIVFNVSQIEIVRDFQSTLLEPNVEHFFPLTPKVAIKQWLEDRVKANGSQSSIQVSILDASAEIKKLETNRDLEGLFTTEQAERIDARIEVRFDLVDDKGKLGPYTIAEAKRSRTIAEGASLYERDRIYFDLTLALMNDFNASMEQALRKYLGKYIWQ